MTPRLWRAARAGAVLVILFATLTPSSDRSAKVILFSGLADALCNLLLFAPLGFALRSGRSLKWTVSAATGLSLLVELLQLLIPGRHTTPADVICNAAGAAFGWWLAGQAPGLIDPPPLRARRLGLLAGLGAMAVLAGSLLLYRYAPSSDDYFAQWTPELGHIGHYDGRIAAAEFNGVSAPDGRIADKRRVDDFARGVQLLHITLVAGTPPAELTDVFSVAGVEKEVMLVAALGDDLLLRYRTVGRALTLNRPLLRVPHAMAHIAPGTRLDLEITRERDWCVRVEHERTCGLGYTPGDGWQLFYVGGWFPGWLLAAVSFGWLAGLMAPVGYWAGGRTAVAFGVVTAIMLAMLTRALREPAVPAVDLVALATGLAAGAALWRLRQPRKDSLANSSRQRSIRS